MQLSFKVIIVGTQCAGKTSLAYNYVNGTFRADYNVTVGVEFSSKTLEIEDTPVQVQIWDTVWVCLHAGRTRSLCLYSPDLLQGSLRGDRRLRHRQQEELRGHQEVGRRDQGVRP